MKKILLATDGSPSSQRATEEAIELARETGSVLHVVTAWTIPISAFGYAPVAVTPEIAEAEREHAEKALAAAVDAAKGAGLEPTPILCRGFAAMKICAVADEIGADLIVIGSHGWNTVKRLFLGSVSTRVLHEAPCPVLVVRGDSAEETEATGDQQVAVAE